MTNGDKIFKAVIEDSALISYGGYNPDNYDSLQNALDDENIVISTVAKIIYYQLRGHSDAYSGGYPFSISGDIRSVPS